MTEPNTNDYEGEKMNNSQTPKEKAIKYAEGITTGSLVDYSLENINKCINIALEEQAKQIFKELDGNIYPVFEDSYDKLKKKWLK